MASDDVELLTEAFGLLNSDHYEQALALIDEGFEMTTTREVASEPDTYRGREGVRRWWESFLEVMDTVSLEALRMHPVEPGRVIVEFLIHARGRRSGIDTAQPGYAVATIGDGKLKRLEFFTGLEEARGAVRPRPG